MKLKNKIITIAREYLYRLRNIPLITCAALVAVLCIAWAYFSNSSALIMDELLDATQQILKQAEINIEATVEYVENASNMIFSNLMVQEALSHEEETAEPDNISRFRQLAEYEKMTGVLNNIAAGSFIDVRLFVDDKKIYSREHFYFYTASEFEQTSWAEAAKEHKGSAVWISEKNADGSATVSCVRIIKSMEKFGHTIGALSVDLSSKRLESILSDITVLGGNNVMIIDGKGMVISSVVPGLAGEYVFDSEALEKLNARESGNIQYDGADGRCSAIYRGIKGTDWRIAAIVPVALLTGYKTNLYRTSVMSLTIILVIVLALIIVFNILNYRINMKIQEMTGYIENENIEIFEENTGGRRPANNIIKLQRYIEQLVINLNNTIHEFYQAKERENEANMKALQSQINPHFLYNTLDTINWLAIKRGADDISYIVEALAEYFRLSLSKGKNIITIADEIELAKAYLAIQNCRFGDCIDVSYDIDQEILAHRIPKISLQPILENALIHGIQRKKTRSGHIDIVGSMKDGYITITVKDDGVGMPPELVQKALLCPEEDEKSKYVKNGYGLYNINERLKLFSKDDSCGLYITSELGAGTEVKIKIVPK